MKKLVLLAFMASILVAPVAAIAQEKKQDDSAVRVFGDALTRAGDATVDTVKENPGKSLGAAACSIIIAFFPPALVACGAAVVGGVGVDVTTDQMEK